MSWQDGLRALDAELAAGQISADEYRMRRDKILSSAVAAPETPGDGGQTTAEKTQTIRPVPVPPQADNQQDRTQVVAGDGIDAADRTQAVGWRAERPGGDADRTQVVSGMPGPGGPHPPPNQGHYPPPGFPRPPWEQEQQQQRFDEGTPWGGSEFPPLANYGNENWVRQGPEVFDGGGSGGKKGRVVAIVLAVVVLAGLAFGAYWLWGRGEPTAGGDPSTAPPAPVTTTTVPTTTTPPDPLPVAELPGDLEKHKKVKAFTDVSKLNYLNPAELAAYKATGPKMAKFNVRHLPSGTTAVFLLVESPDPAKGKKAAAALREIQVDNGASEVESDQKTVLISEIEAKNGQPGQVRAHYMSGDILVRIEVWHPDSLAKAQAEFPRVLQAQLALMPADG